MIEIKFLGELKKIKNTEQISEKWYRRNRPKEIMLFTGEKVRNGKGKLFPA